MNEADTCRKYVVPSLQKLGWDDEPYDIGEQRIISNPKGRIRIVAGKVIRGEAKKPDYLLYYRKDFPIAVVEAKADYKKGGDGLGQAKEYAQLLGIKFAYSTNGTEIVEFDFTTGLVTENLATFPSPAELWERLNATESDSAVPEDHHKSLLTPNFLDPERPPRYYQQAAINSALIEVYRNTPRILITMATGTGKTVVAFQVAYKLWEARWNRKNDPVKRPKILFLADRNILIDDPKDKTFKPFGDARHKIAGGEVVKSREMYFAIYQSIAEDKNRPGLYKEYAPDFFDLIIIDECHRGSAKKKGNWRKILEYFKPAIQIGMTATPLRKDNKATYQYFGNPIYQYSLRQGLDDGFLAPYRVHRVVTSADATGWRPSKGELDAFKREIPDEDYQTPDFERKVSLRPRSEAIAKHLTAFLKRTNRFDKTIVFCVDQDHAEEMRNLLNNLNADLVKQYPNYVERVTSDEGQIGKGHLSNFQELEGDEPVILTTSQLLTTGVDAPMVKNVVLIRMIGSMTEFKQIIGRGTRLREDYGKYYFNIIDYTGTATKHFADDEFDGDPELITEEEIDDEGNVTTTNITGGETPEEVEDDPPIDPTLYPPTVLDPPTAAEAPGKYIVTKGKVDISTELTQDLDAEGKQLRISELRDYTGDVVRSLYRDVSEFRHKWADPEQRKEVITDLEDKGIDPKELRESLKQSDSDPFDLLCHLAWNAPVKTRKERATALKKNDPDFFDEYSEPARKILDALLTKYAEHGTREFNIPDSLKVPPISELGNVSEIIKTFGSAEDLKEAVTRLQSLLYAA